MATSNAEANWEGSLKEGKGGMKLGSGALQRSIQLRHALRRRKRHQPRRADRRRSRGMFLDGPIRWPRQGGLYADAD